MKKVYLIQHVNINNDENDIKVIGIFSTLNKAKAAIKILSKKKGFKTSIKGFSTDEYELDKIFWSEGFITVS